MKTIAVALLLACACFAQPRPLERIDLSKLEKHGQFLVGVRLDSDTTTALYLGTATIYMIQVGDSALPFYALSQAYYSETNAIHDAMNQANGIGYGSLKDWQRELLQRTLSPDSTKGK